jgi:hypothetical protein
VLIASVALCTVPKKANEGLQLTLPNASQLSTFRMKKVMCYFGNIYDRCGGKHLSRLLTLLLVLAVTAPVLLAEDGDHDHDKDGDRGRFVDPIVGSWIVHVTVTSPTGVPPFDDLTALFADGTMLGSDAREGPVMAFGKEWPTGPIPQSS